MAITNHERVGKALDLLNAGLKPFVEREMKAVHGDKWQDAAQQSLRNEPSTGKTKKANWDVQRCLAVMWDQWNNVFNRVLGQAERSIVSELRNTRNRWAHQESFSTDDAYRALDSVGRLLTAVSAGEAEEIEKHKQELLRVRFEEQRRTEARRATAAPVEGRPAGGLLPWREVVTPHPDVASGRYQQAEFAADLWQVYQNEGSDEYKHPTEFYRRTFLTEGLRHLLSRALLRLSGRGGDPVVELQTNFGGGKTHSMLALWHLFSSTPPTELPGVEELVKKVGVPVTTGVKRVAIVGTKISPGQPHKKPDGTVVRTLWGEIAWQLGGKEGYKLVKEADETATNPGDAMVQVLRKYAPCLILIDEWVAYARQLHEEKGLPAGTFETHFTFAQNLTESAKAVKNALLVISVPASESPSPHDGREKISDIEVGGERGRAALARLKNAIGRVEASWRPASPDEGFEIVRRRLFQPITDRDKFTARDNVARAFLEMYGNQHQEFPSDCREADYERRIRTAYPIHPELFDRLYGDWSTLEKFQRTRGVLRLMAAVIHSLWERQDSSLLIMPANVPVDDQSVQFELTRYLEDNWLPVLEKDVDGPRSLPLALDRENPNLGRYSACRRVARTIYMGSAPTQKAANRGLDDRHVKLGCVQPGESVATFGDALRHLTGGATYLYEDGKRYWYSTQPTVTRLADDRATQYREDDVAEEIRRHLRDSARTRGDFAKVHACTASSDVPDDKEARLVILGPEFSHTARVSDSPALREAKNILASRGSSSRNYKNALVFLSADANRLKELEHAIRTHMAWKSIVDEKETLNLDPFQVKQAETKCKSAAETVDARVPEAYQWLLVPGQSDPKGSVEWTETRLQGQDPLAVRAAKKLRNEQMLLVQMGGALLRNELDRVPLWRGDHVSVKQLAEDFATYLYLHRLRDSSVLAAAATDGCSQLTWQSETFGYAEDYDEAKKRYRGLRGGEPVSIFADGRHLLVKPEVASKQLDVDRALAAAGGSAVGSAVATGDPGPAAADRAARAGAATASGAAAPPPVYRRFHGSVRLDSLRVTRDAGKISEEVIKHLTSLVDAKVEVTLEIRAEMDGGAPEKVVRDVTENCRTLRFDSHGFEES